MRPSVLPLDSNEKYRVAGWLFLYLLGIAYWLYFLESGASLVFGDWVKEQAYANILRDAINSGIIPWRWSEPYYHGAYEFIGNPEISLAPDFVLLRWISNHSYFLLHICLFYSAGFYGMARIANKADLRPFGIVFFWLVFNFNGYITSHLHQGHLQWAGYFLIPLFFVFLSEFDQVKNRKSFVYPAFMGLLLGLLFINGSIHVAVWCGMFMVFTVLWKRGLLPGVAVALAIGGLIGACRVVPGALYFPKKDGFITGYPDFNTLLDSFTVLRLPEFPPLGNVMGGVLGWWEFDIYIGFTAFFVFLFCGLASLKQPHRPYGQHILVAGVAMFILSMGNVYALVANSGIPLAGVERVSSRFIVMPFVMLIVMASSCLDRIILSGPRQIKAFAMLAILFIAGELYLNLKYWKPGPETPGQSEIPSLLSIVPNLDKKYEMVVYFSWSISLLVFISVTIYLYRKISDTA